jgi:hypothetical protein
MNYIGDNPVLVIVTLALLVVLGWVGTHNIPPELGKPSQWCFLAVTLVTVGILLAISD